MSKTRRSLFIFSFVGIAAALTDLYLNFNNETRHEDISGIVTWQELASGQVKPQGYGLTVFKGTKVEKFEVEFEGVVPHPIIRNEKMILVRMGRPLIGSSVLSGMSGSPVYFYKNGKPHLLGAIAFGFPIPTAGKSFGGVTPINAMLNQKKLETFREKVPQKQKGLESLSRPIQVGIYNGQPIELLQPMFANSLSSGTEKSANKPARRPLPGEAVTMMLVDGDIKMGGTCTVTYVTANKFWACGHPILMEGEMVAPAKLASIAAPLKGPFQAFKMVQDQHDTVGYISYDGPFAIEGHIKEVPSDAMIPISLNVRINKQKITKINYSVFRNKLYTELLIEEMGMQALESIWNTKRKAITKSVANIRHDNSVTTLYDTSISGSMTNFGPFIMMSNPWSIIGKAASLIGFLSRSEWSFLVKGAEISIDLETGEKVFSLDTIKILNSKNEAIDSLTPGSTAYLLLALRSNEGAKKFVTKIPINIPKNLKFKKENNGEPLTITFAVESGNNYREKDEAKIFSGRPENKKEFLKQLLVNERDPQRIYVQIILPPTKPKIKGKKKVGEKFDDTWRPVKSLKPLRAVRTAEKKIITKELNPPPDGYALNIRGIISLPIQMRTNTASSIPKNP